MSNQVVDYGCSRNALSIARFVDRLEPGEWIVRIVIPNNDDEDWGAMVSQEMPFRQLLPKRKYKELDSE